MKTDFQIARTNLNKAARLLARADALREKFERDTAGMRKGKEYKRLRDVVCKAYDEAYAAMCDAYRLALSVPRPKPHVELRNRATALLRNTTEMQRTYLHNPNYKGPGVNTSVS